MMESFWPALAAVLGVSAALAVFYWMRRHPARGSTVEETLRSLGDDYKALSGLLVTLKGGMFRISHLVVSRWGVFLIDERSEKGAVQGKPDQKEWLVTGLGAGEAIYNPLWRTREAVNSLQSKAGSVPITSLIVFVHARLKSDFGPDVIPLRSLCGRIKRDTRVILDESRMQMILDRLAGK